jgi:uracil phosphoribosyltransferase
LQLVLLTHPFGGTHPNFVTGGSATMAVQVLKSNGVPEDRILFLNLIASPSGVADFAERFPKLRVVTAFIDQGLDEKKYVDLEVERCV